MRKNPEDTKRNEPMGESCSIRSAVRSGWV